MITLYGIKNCDSVKKACQLLTRHNIPYHFHDFKLAGVDKTLLQKWLTQVDWEMLLNRRGTTWRRLPDTDKMNINQASAISLMLANPSLIKRPVVDIDNKIYVGWEALQETL